MGRAIRIAAGMAVGVGAVAGWVWLAPYYSTLLAWLLRTMAPFLLPLAAVLGAAALLGWGARRLGSPLLRTGAWSVVVLGGIGCLVWITFVAPYLRDQVYVQSVEVTDEAPPEFAERAPYQVATAQSRSNLGQYPGETGRTTYLPDQEVFSTMVDRRGMFTGYEATLEQDVPFQGRGQGSACEFDRARADARIGGSLSANLGRQIARERRWVNFSADDAYGYCDGNTPKVVVPLRQQTGWLVVTQRPAGVAVYDGSTGEISFESGEGLPGPSYPITFAERQRKATNALGTYGDWFANRVGWEPSDEAVTSGNSSEFALMSDEGPLWVTPLTRRGSATSISAISTVSAQHGPDSGLATLTVHELEVPWVSPSAVEQRIQADYQDIPNWQNLQVMEIAPTSGKSWAASIGNRQNIMYRVRGQGDLMGDQATCLHRADGTEIRCGTLADSDGHGIGTQYGSDGEDGADGGAAVPPPGELGGLTDDELAALLDEVNDEVGRRLREAEQE